MSLFVYLLGGGDGVGIPGGGPADTVGGFTVDIVEESVVDGCGPELGGIGDGIDDGG